MNAIRLKHSKENQGTNGPVNYNVRLKWSYTAPWQGQNNPGVNFKIINILSICLFPLNGILTVFCISYLDPAVKSVKVITAS